MKFFLALIDLSPWVAMIRVPRMVEIDNFPSSERESLPTLNTHGFLNPNISLTRTKPSTPITSLPS